MIGQTISHYRVLEKIGEGGMGEVYLAEDTSLKRKVALKFLPEYLQQDEVAQKRFLREAKSAGAIDYPFICNIFEIAQSDDGQDSPVVDQVCLSQYDPLTVEQSPHRLHSQIERGGQCDRTNLAWTGSC